MIIMGGWLGVRDERRSVPIEHKKGLRLDLSVLGIKADEGQPS